MTSPVMGCRGGSVDTLWHTSDKRAAVKSLISLCLIDGYPPLGHDSACSTVNSLRGTRDGPNSYGVTFGGRQGNAPSPVNGLGA